MWAWSHMNRLTPSCTFPLSLLDYSCLWPQKKFVFKLFKACIWLGLSFSIFLFYFFPLSFSIHDFCWFTFYNLHYWGKMVYSFHSFYLSRSWHSVIGQTNYVSFVCYNYHCLCFVGAHVVHYCHLFFWRELHDSNCWFENLWSFWLQTEEK